MLLAKLQEALRTAMRTYGWDITFSVGLVTFHLQRRIAFEVAERQMRFAKNQGKNRISYLTVD